MRRCNFFLSLSIFFLSYSTVFAQSDFFFSFDQEGPNTNQSRDFNVGDSGSLWIYWSTNGPADSELTVGAFIDVFTSNSGVIEFTAAETFDYDIVLGGQTIGTRLNGEGLGPAQDLTSHFINEFFGFTVTGPGIFEPNGPIGSIVDEGFSVINDGFEWGRIDFNVIGEGTTSVTGAAGDGMIVNDDSIVDAAFSTVTINATSQIPEPTTTGFFALALAGLAVRRYRCDALNSPRFSCSS